MLTDAEKEKQRLQLEKDKREFGLRLKEVISMEGLTQEKFGLKIGYSDVAIGQILKGKNAPKFQLFKALSRVYPKIDINWLVSGKGEMLGTNKMDIKSAMDFILDNADILKNMEGFTDFKSKLAFELKKSDIEKRLSDIEQKLGKS